MKISPPSNISAKIDYPVREAAKCQQYKNQGKPPSVISPLALVE